MKLQLNNAAGGRLKQSKIVFYEIKLKKNTETS